MRIVFVLPDLPLSGAATRTVHVAEQLVSRGYDVVTVILLQRVDESIARRLNARGIELLRLSSSAGLRRIRRALVADPATIVHAAMPTAGAVGLWLARLFRLPFVYSYTNCLHVDRPVSERTPRDRLKGVLEAQLATRADALHAVSHSVAAQLARNYPQAADRVHAIPYQLTQPAEASPAAYNAALENLREEWPRLLVVGRLLDHKRVNDVIRATRLIRNTWPTVKLVVLGAGPACEKLRQLALREDIEGNVHFTGESDAPGPYFDWADVLVHPSLYEGYPRVFAEALAKRIPIVSIDSPYAREVARINSTVFLARPFDHSSIAEKVYEALDQTEDVPRGESDRDPIDGLCAIYRLLQPLDGHSDKTARDHAPPVDAEPT